MKAPFLAQLKAVLWRNVLLKRRNKSQFSQELFFPLMYIGILVMIRALTKPSTKPAISFPAIPLDSFPIDNSKPLIVVSNGLNVSPVMTKISAQLGNITYQVYPSEADADQAYEADKGNVTVGIIFGYPNTSLIEQYAIRMPKSKLPGMENRYTANQGQCRGAFNNFNGTSSGDCDANMYLVEGVSYLQTVIDHALMQELGVSVPNIKVSAHMMPKGEYTPDLTYIQTISSIYFVLAYSFFVNFLTVSLVAEKEKKIREGMFMMGLRNSVFWLSWSLVYFVIILVVTVLVTVIALAGKFFENSNVFIFFLMLMLYGLSIICLSFLLTPFFKKAKPAGFVASFLTILLSLIYLAVSQTRTVTANEYTNSVPAAAQWAMCLLSPTALAFAVDQGLYLDVAKGGMTFDTMTIGDFPLYAPILMLFIDIILYLLLAIYLDHVIPGEYGPRYKPWYFVQKSYWFPKKSIPGDKERLVNTHHHENGEDVVVSGPNIEPVSADMNSKRTMRVINISKVFKSQDKDKAKGKQKVMAVKNLSLDMYEGQITCLLGHNGAGKTTLINMLTGVIPPTSGTATIRGLDVACSGDMEEIRSMCGICPQHNILYDELTTKEHLEIFAGIKGVPSEKVDMEVKRAMQSVDLLDQADVLASKLSGGQKRKLSVAMALIGDPKIIFLDEPTAGMDPYSRRHLWSLLKSNKEGRLILLTTHFMDEADILSDRKAIISKGSLKCCGSSLFLKSKFGIGYHLNMVVSPSCDADKVLGLLHGLVSGVEVDRCHGKELSYTIPLSEVHKFAEMFAALEAQEGSQTVAEFLGILNYGVSMPTLEEVFLKLEEKHAGEEEENEDSTQGVQNASYNSLSHLDVDFNKIDGRERKSQTAIQMRANQSANQVFTLSHRATDQTAFCFWMMFKLRFLGFWRSKVVIFFLIFLPIGLVTGALLLNKNSKTSPDTVPVPLDLTTIQYARLSGSSDTSVPKFAVQDTANNTISQGITTEIQNKYQVDSYSPSASLMDVAPHFLGTNLLTTDATTSNLASYVALFNDTAIHSLPVTINTLTSAILKKAGSAASIKTTILPWISEPKRVFDGGSFSSSLMVGIAFALTVPVFGIIVVQDKQWKCKSQLRVSGVSFHMYWGAMFLFDLMVTLIPATACLILALALQVPSFMPGGAVLALILLFIIFVPLSLFFSLVFSFAFDKYETAQAIMPNVFIWMGMIPYLIVSMVDVLGSSNVATAIHCIFVFIDPVYIIFGGFYYIDRIYRISEIFQTELSFGDYFEFKNNILICLIAGVIDFVLLYFLLRILEVRSNGGSVRDALRFGDVNSVAHTPEINSDTIEGEDEDVATEREFVNNLEQGAENSQNCVAYVRQIRKEFVKTEGTKKPCSKPPPSKIKVAVRNLSFSVNKGEVLGLLGPNGAGKTTALNMMTADVHPNKGKVVVGDTQVCSNISEAFQHLGFCPQHDPLWEPITLAEHLELYAAFKGVPKNEIPAVVDFFVENLKLEEHRNKNAKKLSGGTKRKLSYAMSMLGLPKVVLLDEPSTGMDPQSKRFLWDTISSSFEGQERGAILTTHYMEEADALCTRVGIMVNGQLECLGPTQHLKAKYGSGYLLEVKLDGSSSASREDLEERIEQLEQHLLTLFPNATCLESFAERAQYKIPQSDVPALSLVFAELERTKQTHEVEEYSFSQSTLEQVFLNFAKKQLEEGEDADAGPSIRTERQLSRSVNSPSAHDPVVVKM